MIYIFLTYVVFVCAICVACFSTYDPFKPEEEYEDQKAYKSKLSKLKTFSESNSMHYFSKTVLRLQHLKEFRDPKSIDFYMQLDEYFVNTDLETIKNHLKYYQEHNPKDKDLHTLMNKLIYMKLKEVIFQVEVEESLKNQRS